MDADRLAYNNVPLRGPVTTKTNKPFTIERSDVALPQISFQHRKGRSLGAARGLAYIAHVLDMKVYEFAESFQARYTGLGRRLTAINLALGFGGPAACVVSPQERLAGVATFATDLHTPGTGRELCVGRHFSCALRVQ
ncbi:hypothetical protein LB523_17010 [Mesorhizobium sp. ESP-6-4]|uniref:hypothetical protein n=1 Tax=Mesorhizobium sp. ESP-6-4 TaxID=2876624 RepID=UPI001CCBF891|nr:hypothetical protein [Mesorhizobium sp. ESP-6-4]MBZ9660755.1 hypothetical protein [Mesorhizobium sp. ESP-6-4]